MIFKKLKFNLFSIIAITLCLFHLYTGVFGLLPSMEQRSFHVALSLILILLPGIKLLDKNNKFYYIFKIIDSLLIISVLIASGYIFFNYLDFLPFMSRSIQMFEIILATLIILAILESARRTVGWFFPFLTAIIILYALYGHYIPGFLGHAHLRPSLIFEYLFLSPHAIWGSITGLSATYISLFIIFGSFLLSCGGGQTLMELSIMIAGKYVGGPAKVAVISSGLVSMISGSSIANVVTTGSFTIPLMKKLGYPPSFAGAVESVASTGGMVTPPVMGAAAFIMAELLGITYLQVVIAASLPAILFYISVLMAVHLQAVKLNLKPIPKEDFPAKKDVFVFYKLFNLFFPIGVLLYTLFSGYSLIKVGANTCIATLIPYLIFDVSLKGVRDRLHNLMCLLKEAGESLANVVPVLICANIILFLLDLTGLSPKFSSWIMKFAGTNLILAMILTAFLVMILGMGLPTTAAYVMGVAVAAPRFVEWGVTPIAAHLFVLYYSILATITPPVCPTVFVASSIAKSDWLKTGWTSVKLAPILYILPFLFIYDNTFVLIGSPIDIILNVSTATVGVLILMSGIMRRLIINCNLIESIVLIIAGLFLVLSGWVTDVVGFLLFLVVFIRQINIFKAKNNINIQFNKP